MPTYGFVCDKGHSFDLVLPLSEYDSVQQCSCGRPAMRQISRPRIWSKPEIYYTSPIDGRPITTQRARNEDLARSNCQPYDPEMKRDYDRRVKEREAALEKAVDETVERAFDAMPSAKKEKLAAEITAGAIAEPVRQTAGKATKVAIAR